MKLPFFLNEKALENPQKLFCLRPFNWIVEMFSLNFFSIERLHNQSLTKTNSVSAVNSGFIYVWKNFFVCSEV